MEGSDANQEINTGPRRQAMEQARPQEFGYLSQSALGRILDLKQTDTLLRMAGSSLPVERRQELHKSVSLHLEQNVGSNIDPVKSLTDPTERNRMQNFLSQWDQLPSTVRDERISTALKVLDSEELDGDTLRAKKQKLQQDIAKDHDGKTHLSVKALSKGEMDEWDGLRKQNNLSPNENLRLRELQQRARQERDKALDATGTRNDPLPMLVNPEVRKKYEELLRNQNAAQKIKGLDDRLPHNAPETQSKEAPAPFSHEKFQALLVKQIANIKETLRKSGDYRLWVIPMNQLEFAEKELVPKITAGYSDTDGTLRLIQSIMDMRNQFRVRSEDVPRVGTLRELSGMLPKQETSDAKAPNLSPEELSQRKTDALGRIDNLRSVFARSGDRRLWMLPNQVCDTARSLVQEITIDGQGQMPPEMIQNRVNTIASLENHYLTTYQKK